MITVIQDTQAMTSATYFDSSATPEYKTIKKGTVGKYDRHVVGGNILLIVGDEKLVVHPAATDCN